MDEDCLKVNQKVIDTFDARDMLVQKRKETAFVRNRMHFSFNISIKLCRLGILQCLRSRSYVRFSSSIICVCWYSCMPVCCQILMALFNLLSSRVDLFFSGFPQYNAIVKCS